MSKNRGELHISAFSDTFFLVADDFIQITSPIGGERWASGTTRAVTWTSNLANSETFRLDLYQDGAWKQTITANTANNGSFSWIIPANLANGNYTVKITSNKTTGLYSLSWSDFFISIPSMTLSSPNGGQNWVIGRTYDIAWNSNAGGTVSIQLDKDGVIQTRLANVNNSGYSNTKNVRMPTTLAPGNDYKIVIASESDSSWTDSSDDVFTLMPGEYLALTTPVGGETLYNSSDDYCDIIWDSNISGKAKLSYANTTLESWTVIAEAVAITNGTYRWNTANLPTGSQYKVKIDSLNGIKLSSQSGDYFTVTPKPYFTITASASNGGSTSPSGDVSVAHGANQAFDIVPDTGYNVTDVLVDGISVGAVSSYAFIDVTTAHSIDASFVKKTYTATYAAGENGGIEGEMAQTVEHGGSCSSVTAMPNAHHHFVSWSDGSTANPRTDTNVTANLSVTASFAIDTFTLAYTTGANGTLEGETSQTVNYGASGTAIMAKPDAHHHFASWSDGSTENPRTDTNVIANVSVTANFAIDTFTLVYAAGENGSLGGEAHQTVPYSASGTAVMAAANTGYHFVSWSDGSTANPRTDAEVATNIIVTARFAIDTFKLAYTSGAAGTLAGELSQTVEYGASGTPVTTVPDTGHHFVSWSDGSIVTPRIDLDVTADIAVTASFAINTYTLAYTAGAYGNVLGVYSQTVDYGASGTVVKAAANTGYHFVSWSDGSTTNPRTDTNVMANINIMAAFAIDTFTLTYTAGENGSLTGEPDQTVNYMASGSAVTAVPGTGYHLVSWSDGSTTNPRTDTNVSADLSVTANFAINTYTLNYAAGANGTLEGETAQTVSHGASGTAITAKPDVHHHFVGWSDGSMANPRIDANVAANISVKANFAIDTFILAYNAGDNGSLTGAANQTVAYGASGTAVMAVANTGRHFVSWSDGSTANPRTDSGVTADLSVTASFAIDTFTLVYTASANGKVDGQTAQTVNYMASGSAVTAVPNTGHHFVSWSDGSTANPRADANVTANIAVTASFAINVYIVTFVPSSNGSITGTLVQTVQEGKDCEHIEAVPDVNYTFTGWTGDYVGGDNPLTVSKVMSNMTINANFALKTYAIDVSVDAAADSGMVDPGGKSATIMVGQGANQTFTITPYSGCRIADVLVDGVSVGSVTSYTFTAVSAAHTLKTSFAAIAAEEFVITATAGFGGTVTPSGETVVVSGASVPVAITPDSGYAIKNVWVDGVSIGAVYSYKFTAVSADHSLNASFSVSDGGQALRAVNGNSITLQVTPPPSGTTAWGCEELLPEGLTPDNITGSNGSWNAAKRKITWNGEGNASERLSYTVNGGAGTYVVSGGASFGDATITTVGDSGVILSSLHPADQGGDWAIVMQEAISYVAGWQAGTNPMSYAARALYIWKNGEDYHFDSSLDRPDCWVLGVATEAAFKRAAVGTSERSVNATTNIVTIKVTPPAGALVWTCEEFLPEGLAAGNITGANQNYNDATRKISWYDFVVDTTPVELTYTVSGAPGSYSLDDGSAAFDGTVAQTSPGVTVVIAKQRFVITPAAGPGGRVSPDTAVTLDSGSAQEFAMVPDIGHHITDVLVDGSSVGPVASYKFANVTKNYTITASFALDTFTLEYTAGTGGTLSGVASQTVEYGASGTAVGAVPDTGYHFVAWSDGSTSNPRMDANVTKDIAVSANFAIDTFTLAYAAGPNGTLSGDTTQTVDYGASGSAVTAVSGAGYHFVTWSDGSTVNPRMDANIKSALSVTAAFAINTYALTYIAGANGTLEGETSQTVNYGTDGTAVAAKPSAHHHFVAWSDGSTVNPRTDTDVKADLTVTANFAIDTFTLAYSAGANGKLEGATPQTVAYGASGTAVSAVADTGHHFVSWSDGSTDSVRVDKNVTADLSVTATFAINVYAVTFAATAGGSLEGQTTQSVEHGASCSAVTAVRELGYEFTGWDNGFGVTNPLTVTNVTSDMTITATFTKKAKPEYWVAYGSLFTVNASDLEGGAPFAKAPKVVAYKDGKAGGKAKVQGFKKGASSVNCVWQGKDKPGTYSLQVNGETLTEDFVVENPNAFDVTLTPDTGMANDKITVTGSYFGSKCPKVTMEWQVESKGKTKTKKATCKVIKPYKYDDANGKAGKSVMYVGQEASESGFQPGDSELTFVVPKGITEATTVTLKLNCNGTSVERPFNPTK